MGVTTFDVIQANAIVGASASDVPGAKTFYLNNSGVTAPDGIGGSNGNSGTSPQAPLSTLAYALSLCTAGRGDRIVIAPGHAETITSTLTVPAGVQVVGVQVGNKRPVFTINGATDLFNLSGAGASLYNLEMRIATTDAATAFVNVAAADCAVVNCFMVPSTSSNINVVDVITIASGANHLLLDTLDIRNTSTPVNSFISIEAAVANLTIRNCFFFGDCVTAGFIDAAAATQVRIEGNTIGTIGTTIPAVILDSNPTGVVDNNRFLGTHTTIASNAQLGNAVRQARSYVLEETDNSKQATNIIPALDVE